MFKFEEKIILQQIRRGNRGAFSYFYDQYQDKLYRFIYFRVSNQSVAQDLTSETFMKVLNYLLNGQEIKNFKSFIYQTAKNLVIDFYRQRGQEELPIDDFVRENIPEEKDLVHDTAIKFELSQVEKAVQKLPNPYQEVVVLRFVEDLSFREIGQIVGVKEEYARMLAHRGLKMLKNQLEKAS